jgi:hypothetical protein
MGTRPLRARPRTVKINSDAKPDAISNVHSTTSRATDVACPAVPAVLSLGRQAAG